MRVTKPGIKLNVKMELIKLIYIQYLVNKLIFIKHFLHQMDIVI